MDNIIKAMASQLLDIRTGGKVERCHVIPHNGSYSNAAHQWGVAMLMFKLWRADFPRLAAVCLVHDVPEAWVGDIPSTITGNVPGLKEEIAQYEERIFDRLGIPADTDLDPEDYRKLKACDALEFYMWCRDQQAMGNEMVKDALQEVRHMLHTAQLPSPAGELLAELEACEFHPKQAGVIRRLALDIEGEPFND